MMAASSVQPWLFRRANNFWPAARRRESSTFTARTNWRTRNYPNPIRVSEKWIATGGRLQNALARCPGTVSLDDDVFQVIKCTKCRLVPRGRFWAPLLDCEWWGFGHEVKHLERDQETVGGYLRDGATGSKIGLISQSVPAAPLAFNIPPRQPSGWTGAVLHQLLLTLTRTRFADHFARASPLKQAAHELFWNAFNKTDQIVRSMWRWKNDYRHLFKLSSRVPIKDSAT